MVLRRHLSCPENLILFRRATCLLSQVRETTETLTKEVEFGAEALKALSNVDKAQEGMAMSAFRHTM